MQFWITILTIGEAAADLLNDCVKSVGKNGTWTTLTNKS